MAANIFCLLFFTSDCSGLENGVGLRAGYLLGQMRCISFLLLISKGSGYDLYLTCAMNSTDLFTFLYVCFLSGGGWEWRLSEIVGTKHIGYACDKINL
jgi:hypothetical protein